MFSSVNVEYLFTFTPQELSLMGRCLAGYKLSGEEKRACAEMNVKMAEQVAKCDRERATISEGAYRKAGEAYNAMRPNTEESTP